VNKLTWRASTRRASHATLHSRHHLRHHRRVHHHRVHHRYPAPSISSVRPKNDGATHASYPACFPACSPASRPFHHGPFPFPGYYPCLLTRPSDPTEAHRCGPPYCTLRTLLRLDRAARIRHARLRARLDRSIRRQKGHGVHPRVRRACRICCLALREAPTSDCAPGGGRMRTFWYQFVRVSGYTRPENGRYLLSLEFPGAISSVCRIKPHARDTNRPLNQSFSLIAPSRS
jgi:hypothetical protein